MIQTELMKHQQIVCNFTRNKIYSGIFCKYGTGKTLMVLNHINNMQFVKSLIVCSKTAIESTWVDEIGKHSDFQFIILTGTRKQKLERLKLGLQRARLDSGFYNSSANKQIAFLINFDGIKGIFNELCQCRFDFLVVDESTRIKSHKTERTKILWALGKYVKSRCITTGFPITENLSDLYAQIKFLDHGKTFGNSYHKFMDEYFVKHGYKYFPKKNRISELLDKIKPFCISITGSIIKLPPSVYKRLAIQLTTEQKEILDSLNNEFRVEFGNVSIDTKYIFTILNKSLQVCDGFIQSYKEVKDDFGNTIIKNDKPVLEKVVEFIPTNKDELLLDLLDEINVYDNKVLIWFAFKVSLLKIEQILTKLGYTVLTLYGDTQDINATVNKFQHGKFNILLATQKKASESITLSNCNNIIYYSNPWSADLRTNSEARTCRKGSEIHDSIIYTDIYTKGAIDEKVLKCLQSKKDLIALLKQEFGGVAV